MDKFKIRVARIEMISPNERGEDIGLTFQFESHQTSFALPIFLNSCEFDDTEIVKVARSKLSYMTSSGSSAVSARIGSCRTSSVASWQRSTCGPASIAHKPVGNAVQGSCCR